MHSMTSSAAGLASVAAPLRISWRAAISSWLQSRSNRLYLTLLLVGSILRLWQIGQAPLWYDERLEAWVVSLPLDQMLAAVGADVHPPAHYLLMWALTHLGLGSPFWLRLPSAILGAVAIVQTRQLALRWDLSPAAAVGAALLTAVLPFQLNYSQEARMYALLQFALLWSLLEMIRGRWMAMAAALTLLVYSHNYGWVYAALILPLAAGRMWGWLDEQATPRRWLLRVLALYAVPVLAYLPWSATLAAQMAEQATAWWKSSSTLGTVLFAWYFVWWQTTIVGTLATLAAAATFGVLVLAVAQVVRTRLRTGAVLIYLAVGPALAALAIELVYRPILLHRTMIGAAVPMYLLAAHALDTITHRRLAWSMLAPLLFLGAVAFHPLRQAQNSGQLYEGPDVYAYIDTHWQAGDVIAHGSAGTLVDARGRLDRPQVLLPIQPGSRGVPSAAFWRRLGVEIADPSALSARRVWVVWSAGPTIAAAEDDYIRSLTADAAAIWTGHTPVADAGLWLLTPPTAR